MENFLIIKIKSTVKYVYSPPDIEIPFEGSVYALLEILNCIFYSTNTYFTSEFMDNTLSVVFLVVTEISMRDIHSKLNNQLHNLSLFNIKKEKYETKI